MIAEEGDNNTPNIFIAKRTVCEKCETVLAEGNPEHGTDFKICTDCVREATPGADTSAILNRQGRRIKRKNNKPDKVNVKFDYVMVEGKIIVQVLFKLQPSGAEFDIGLTEEQINQFATEMKDIRQTQELQKKLSDNLEQ